MRLGNTSPGRELNSLNEEDLIYTTLSLVRASSRTRGLNSTYARRRGPTESRRSGRLSAIAVESVDIARGNDGNGRNGVSLVSVTGCANLQQTFHENNLVSALSLSLSRSRWRATFVFAAFIRARQERAPPRAVSRNNKCRSISGATSTTYPAGVQATGMSGVRVEREWTGKQSNAARPGAARS